MTESNSNAMKGVITMNESHFLGEDQVFQWSSHVAESAIQEIVSQEQRIEKLQLKDIDCSTEVLQ